MPIYNAGLAAGLANRYTKAEIDVLLAGGGGGANTTVKYFDDYIPEAERAGIRARTSTYACDSAWNTLIASLPERGGYIRVGLGKYNFAETIHLRKMIVLEGESTGISNEGFQTTFQFPAEKHGIVVHTQDTDAGGVDSSPVFMERGEGSVIRGIALVGNGGFGPSTPGTHHGVWMRGRALCENMRVDKFAGNGFNVVADVTGSGFQKGNANSFGIRSCVVSNCGGHGVFTQYGDSNAGVIDHVDSNGHLGWGFWDDSFLGNTYIGCHQTDCGLGAYKSVGLNARNVFIGCYSEGDTPPSLINTPAIVMGGLHGAGMTGNGLFLMDDNISGFHMQSVNMETSFMPNRETENTAIRIVGTGDHGEGWKINWDSSSKVIEFRHANLDGRIPIRLTTDISTSYLQTGTSTPVPGGQILFEHGFWVSDGSGKWKKPTFP